jgi:DNA modification methylase
MAARRRKYDRVKREGREYLAIPVDPGRPLLDQERAAIRDINAASSQKEFFLAEENGILACFVNTISPEELQQAVRNAVTGRGLNELYTAKGVSDPFSAFLARLDEIGSYGIRNGRRVYAGYDGERKVEDRAGKAGRRGAVYYSRGHSFTQEKNDLPRDFSGRVMCGDAEEVLGRLPDNCIDLVFTSPPYNFGLAYGSTGDEDMWERYFDKLFAVFDECIRVLCWGGRIVVNVQPLFSDYIPSHHVISQHLMKRHLIWKGEVLWEKNNYNCKYTSWGSWKSPSSPYLKYTWEFLEIFAKGDLKKKGSPENADITADEFKEWVVARWAIAPERRMKELDHPAVFPEALAERVIKLFSFSGDAVLDPFNGVGTTTAVATRLNRRALGIDIDPGYCRTATERLEKEHKTARNGRQATLPE